MLSKVLAIAKKDNAVVLLGNLSASALGVITFMLLARSLNKADFGEWAIFTSAVGLLELMKTGLIRQALVRAIATETAPEKQKALFASAFIITIISSLIIAVIIGGINIFMEETVLKSFFFFYPLYSLAAAAHNFDTWVCHASGKYLRMNGIRLVANGLFVIPVAIGFFINLPLATYFLTYIIVQVTVSLFSYFSHLKSIDLKLASKTEINSLLHFGKHGVMALSGINLLKSADSLLIGWFLGKEAAATYAIPLKLLDLVEIPLRGFVMTAFRKLSTLHAEGKVDAFKYLLKTQIRNLTAISLPVAALMVIFPDIFIKILGGQGFNESHNLLRIFVIPMTLLPTDKFIGASLDAANLPKINAIKVWTMATFNIVADIIAIYTIGELWAVAMVTIFTSTIGLTYGLLNHPYFILKTRYKLFRN